MGKIDAFISTPLEEALKEPEVEEVTEEDMLFLDYGMDATLFKGFYIKNPEKNIFYRGKLVAFAFQFYLDSCNQELFDAIRPDALPEVLRKRYDKMSKNGIVDAGFSDKKGGSVAEYIQEVERLRKEVDKWHTESIEHLRDAVETLKLTKWLYDYLNNEEKVEIKNNTNEDIKMIKEIEEVLDI